MALYLEFDHPVDLKKAQKCLQQAPGVTLFDDYTNQHFATPLDATGKDDVFCSRLRTDSTEPTILELWVVGDQLLKGAALNAVQIAEKMIHQKEVVCLLP